MMGRRDALLFFALLIGLFGLWWLGGAPAVSAVGPASVHLPLILRNQVTSSWDIQCVDCPVILSAVRAVSLRLGKDGLPRAAYVHDSLCYARYDGSAWYTETVDYVPGGDQVPAPSVSLALDGTGTPHIGYVAGGQLRYARRAGAGWVTHTVAAAGEWVSLAVDDAGIPHLSYTAPQGLIYARREGNTWVTATITDTASGQTSLALDRSGQPHIAFAAHASLGYAHKDGDRWVAEVADRVEGVDSYADYCSLAVDAEGIPHIAYHAVYYAPFPFHELRYTYRDSGGWSAPQIVDSGALYWWAGRGLSLALDHTGAAHVAYLAGFRIDAEVRYAHQGTDGWAIRRVEFTRYAEPSPSLALDRFERPTILYYDQESQELKCARWERNDWDVTIVEPRGGYVGQYSALVLDATGNAHIGYTGSAGESVRYARWSAGGWHITTITRGIVWGISLALDSVESPHLCFCGPAGLRYARRTAGDWLVTTVSATPCRGVSLALDGEGKPHISTIESEDNYESYVLSYTHWNGQAWLRTVVSPLDTESASLALDGAGNPHIAYLDRGSEMLRYADLGGSGWTSQEVDHGDPWGVVSLALDGTGRPHIAYDAGGTDGEVRYAHGDGGAWITATIAAEAWGGSLALDGTGRPQISYGSWASDTVALLYAYRDGDRWITESIEQPAILWETCCSLALDAQGRPHVSYHVYYDPRFGGGLKVAARR